MIDTDTACYWTWARLMERTEPVVVRWEDGGEGWYVFDPCEYAANLDDLYWRRN